MGLSFLCHSLIFKRSVSFFENSSFVKVIFKALIRKIVVSMATES